MERMPKASCHRVVLSVFSLLLAGTSAHAQAPMGGGASTRPIRLIISGGLTLPSGDLKSYHDATGVHADASLLLRFAGLPLTLRPEFSITRLKQNAAKLTSTLPTPAIPQPQTGGTTQMLGALGNIELPIAGGLYVLGGAGLLQLDSDAQSEAKVTFNVGAGARFSLGRIDGFLEARFGTASYTAGTFGYSKTSFIPITFGLTF